MLDFVETDELEFNQAEVLLTACDTYCQCGVEREMEG